MIAIGAARTDEDFAAARTLVAEYAAQLGVDLCFQHLDAELADLRGHYGAPGGCLLLARADAEPVGCVAVRPLGDGVCEMKRLYLRPAARGTGLGRRLAQAAIAAARAAGHRRMVLDTLATMAPALGLYAALGFCATVPYYANPLPGVVYLSLPLAPD